MLRSARTLHLFLAGLALVASPASAQGMRASEYSAAETKRILSLGPWPPPAQADPGNRVSGQVQAIELGRRLFRDSRMSPVGYIACVTCHQPDRAFTDLKARAHGLGDLPRNTPTLANLRQQRWYGWTGSNDSLWMASIKPMLDSREFDGNAASVTRIFKRDPDLAACFRRAFRDSPFRNPQDTVVNVGKALAAFVETLVTDRTPFDEYRQGLAGRTDASAVAAYPPAAQRGLKLFVGEGQCIDCHKGPNFSDGRFHSGLSRDTDASAPAVARTIGSPALDAGRLDGASELTKSPFNLLGLYNDDSSRANAVATSRLTAQENMRGQFRTPSLRNVAVTAPYMHDGHLDDLRAAIRHAPPRPTRGNTAHALTEQQVDDVAAFLVTLTDRYGERRPWVTASNVRCL